MTNHSRAILARWGRDALIEYDRVSGGGCTEAATIPLAMASLAHFAEQLNPGQGKAALESALALFIEESSQ